MALTKVGLDLIDASGKADDKYLKGDGTWGTIASTDTTGIEDDIALLGFKVALNGSMAKYNLVNQTEDAFYDDTGIDAADSIGEVWNVAKYFSGVSDGNYFGDESDGVVTISTDTNETVLNKVGSYDGDMLVKNYSSLTIDATKTLTLDQPARGMLIYVKGDCVINGTLSMTARGALADPTVAGGSDSSAVSATGLRLPLKKSGSTDTLAAADFAGTGNAAVAAVANHDAISGDGKIYTVGRTGGAGTPARPTVTSCPVFAANPGTSGVATLSSGGGGGGGGCSEGVGISIGGGATGTVFSGGSGGGGSYGSSGGQTVAGNGVANGGAGGQGGGTAVYGQMSGGAGNPGGASVTQVTRMDGTGGLLILLVGGDLTIGASGSIETKGVDGGSGATNPAIHTSYGGGGASGGGKLLVLHGGTLTNNGSITSAGGVGGAGDVNVQGHDGGAGHLVTEVIDGPPIAGNMTLVSELTEAEAIPTNGDIVMTYTNGVAGVGGVTVINTDLKAYASRDDGSNWTQLTLSAQGSTGSHFIVSSHNVDISSQPSDKTMRYKIETFNQGIAKETRIQAVSLGWS